VCSIHLHLTSSKSDDLFLFSHPPQSESNDLFRHHHHSHPLTLPRDRFSSILCKFNHKKIKTFIGVCVVSPWTVRPPPQRRHWLVMRNKITVGGNRLQALITRSAKNTASWLLSIATFNWVRYYIFFCFSLKENTCLLWSRGAAESEAVRADACFQWGIIEAAVSGRCVH